MLKRINNMTLHGLLLAVIIGLSPQSGAEQKESTDTPDNKTITAVIDTNKGKITLELYPDKAPVTVANFVEYNSGFYNDTIFHRVVPGLMIMGGGYTFETKKKKTRATIKNEADNGLKNIAGTIGMAHSTDPQSATSQFYINLADNVSLDYTAPTPGGWGYAVFGKVVDGMDAVKRIEKVRTMTNFGMQNIPTMEVNIRRITIQD